MWEGEYYDCKSISNAIYCLSKLYGKKCRFENVIRINGDMTMGGGHMGIYCWRDNYYGWEVMY